MTRYVKATFSDGTVLTRSSVTKVYTHAYLVRGWHEVRFPYGNVKVGDAVDYERSGFSGSADQARKNMAAETAWLRPSLKAKSPRDVTYEEVVAVVEVDAREYRALNAAGHASTGNARATPAETPVLNPETYGDAAADAADYA